MSAIEDALIAWAPMIESGYKVPAAGQVMREAAAELARLRERNAELEKERDEARSHWQAMGDEAEKHYDALCDAETRLTSLEATVREMREALKPMAEAGKKLRKIIGDEDISDWCMNYRGFKVADFDAALAAFIASESVLKSEG